MEGTPGDGNMLGYLSTQSMHNSTGLAESVVHYTTTLIASRDVRSHDKGGVKGIKGLHTLHFTSAVSSMFLAAMSL